MSAPKTERNKLIVQLKDEKGWSFNMIAKEFGIKAKSRIHDIYHTEKRRSECRV